MGTRTATLLGQWQPWTAVSPLLGLISVIAVCQSLSIRDFFAPGTIAHGSIKLPPRNLASSRVFLGVFSFDLPIRPRAPQDNPQSSLTPETHK